MLSITTERAAVVRKLSIRDLDDDGFEIVIDEPSASASMEIGPADAAAVAAYLLNTRTAR